MGIQLYRTYNQTRQPHVQKCQKDQKYLCIDFYNIFNSLMKGSIIHDVPAKNHIVIIETLLSRISKYHLLPLFVFDGKSPPIKDKVVEERNKNKSIALDKIKQLDELHKTDTIEYRRELAKSYKVTKEIRLDIINYLSKNGIKYIIAKQEADPLLAKLSHHPDVYTILTDDADIITFGGISYISYMNFKQDITKIVTIYDKMLTCLNSVNTILHKNKTHTLRKLTIDEYIILNILLKNDYIYDIHIKNEQKIKLVASSRFDINKIITELATSFNITLPEDFTEKFQTAFDYYKTEQNTYTPEYIAHIFE